MFGMFSSCIVNLSIPMLKPPCGGAPYLKCLANHSIDSKLMFFLLYLFNYFLVAMSYSTIFKSLTSKRNNIITAKTIEG